MTHGRKFRNFMALAVGLAVVSFGPSGAFAAPAGTTEDPDVAPKRAEKRHFPKYYRVERQLTLFADEDGEYFHTSTDQSKDAHTFCKTGDIAIDGMWKVMSIDQNALGVQDPTDIQVVKSYSDSTLHEKWHFEFFFNSDQTADEEERDSRQAQVKLFATCLGKTVAENGHVHDFALTGDGYFGDATYTLTASTTSVVDLGFAGTPATGDCPDGYYAVAPGFNWDPTNVVAPPNDPYGDLQTSRPKDDNLRNWLWRFWVINPGTVQVTYKCLNRQSTAAGTPSHHHHLHATRKSNTTKTVLPKSATEDGIETFQIGCFQHSKAMLHQFNILTLPNHHLWFVGMDPNPKKRAYTVFNKHTTSQTGDFAAVCWNDRTGKKHNT